MEAVLFFGQTLPLAKVASDIYKKLQHNKELDILQELNIQQDIEFVESLLKEVVSNPQNMEKETIKTCVKQIYELIIKIKSELDEIELLIVKGHYAKYYYYKYLWSYYRYYTSTGVHVKNIKNLKSSLTDRSHLLIRLIKN